MQKEEGSCSQFHIIGTRLLHIEFRTLSKKLEQVQKWLWRQRHGVTCPWVVLRFGSKGLKARRWIRHDFLSFVFLPPFPYAQRLLVTFLND